MPSLNLRRSLPSRSILALVPVAVLAAVFALGVPGEGSGVPCKSDKQCPNGEACGDGVCESVEGGCGGEQDSGVGVAENQAEGAQKVEYEVVVNGFSEGDIVNIRDCYPIPKQHDCAGVTTGLSVCRDSGGGSCKISCGGSPIDVTGFVPCPNGCNSNYTGCKKGPN